MFCTPRLSKEENIMRLLRVQVPEFRALKDVDISFEPEFTPQVFPLGSLNGGGKSTLLQLIFVLLHCSANKERHQFIANMLESVTIPEGETSKLFAKFELQEGEEKFELEFTVCNDGYLRQLDIDSIFNKEMVSFSLFAKKIELDKKRQYSSAKKPMSQQDSEEIKRIEPLISNILNNLEKNKRLIVTHINQSIGIICYLSNFTNIEKTKKNLNYISSVVFLSAPESQIYLFLKKYEKESFFRKDDLYKHYIKESKKTLLNFLTFDIFSPNTIAALFEEARNQDFKVFVETGENGSNYKKITDELSLFADKKVIPQIDENSKVTGVIFKSSEGIELYPEDLSHGELKRLSIYVWLKTMPKRENIVLMDEIENGFHPDWQYTIVRNLIDWGKNNQYILATHSYELCTAVTPAHVKELEPKLIKN
jgi:predicted ATPase